MKKTLKLLFFLALPLTLSGQLTPYSNQYMLNPLAINPAFAGNRGILNMTAFYRKQWVGVKGSPETISLTADIPFSNNKMGLGLSILNDKLGVTRETQLSSSYAYKIAMKKGTLSFGLSAGLVMTNTAWSDLIVIDPGDEFILVDSKVFLVPTFSFGTWYAGEKYFAGFSVPRLVGYKFDFEKNKYVLNNNMNDYYYQFNTGYLIGISSDLKFVPSVLVSYSPKDNILYDINAHLRMMDRFWVGASYRNGRAFAAMFQVQLTNQIKCAYTYDFDFAKLRTFSSGSHEIMFRYEFRYRVEAISPLNF
ncbi:MAG TPA: type IX secretion system membrane protein PorP/SprF [Bacteroidales bacterium]|jgi:type IX secretion system PorP/SprF family membrane protein|nr:type IX secretion system membrane protein PorP/SprF [Bacteroidales bacterium]